MPKNWIMYIAFVSDKPVSILYNQYKCIFHNCSLSSGVEINHIRMLVAGLREDCSSLRIYSVGINQNNFPSPNPSHPFSLLFPFITPAICPSLPCTPSPYGWTLRRQTVRSWIQADCCQHCTSVWTSVNNIIIMMIVTHKFTGSSKCTVSKWYRRGKCLDWFWKCPMKCLASAIESTGKVYYRTFT